ncbi:MAG: MotA/TolQ/ExbB proton channel family protein [Planctomycetota bacterium]
MRRNAPTPRAFLSAALAAACALSGAASSGLSAAEAAPSAPTDPAARELARALRDAREELKSVTAEAAREASAFGDEIAALEERNGRLREDGRAVEARLRALEKEISDLDKAIESSAETRSRADESLRLALSELQSQAGSFAERLGATILAAEDPQLLRALDAVREATIDKLPEAVEEFFDVSRRVLRAARTVSVGRAKVELPSRGGRLEDVRVLRVGLLGGYYAVPPGGEVGFVLAGTESGRTLRGEPRGISAAQAREIRGTIEAPARGGLLPFDVSGGAGFAALQTRQSFARWFEAGGFAMWPLLGVFLIAVALIVERAAALTWRSIGIGRKTRKVIELVRAGRVEEAEAFCDRMGGAVGGVLHAALAHRHGGRSLMEDAVQEALLYHAPAFQTRLGFLALCAAVAPLLGLFGTVTGMITTFKMVTLFGTSDPRFLAGGISEALITTETGLMIAIPSLLMRGVLGALAESALGKLEAGALSLVIELVKSEERVWER